MYIDEQGIQFSDDKKTLLHFPSNLVGVYILPYIAVLSRGISTYCRVKENFRHITQFLPTQFINILYEVIISNPPHRALQCGGEGECLVYFI